MYYSEENSQKIQAKYSELLSKYSQLMTSLVEHESKLSNDKAIQYLRYGVSRRLKTLYYAIVEVFRLFPVDQDSLISDEDLTKVDINLHAFLINIAGVLDNISWVIAYEHNLVDENDKRSKFKIGLYKKEFQKSLKQKFLYIVIKSKAWHEDYIKEYRDRLAHRIPLYIPPSGLNEKEVDRFNEINRELSEFKFPSYSEPSFTDRLDLYAQKQEERRNLGRPIPMFAIGDFDEVKPLMLHPQMIVDFLTVEEILNEYLKCY